MKTLENLNNVEKGKLMHELFPKEIPALLEFVHGMCATIKENEPEQRRQWEHGLFGFDFWLSLVSDVEKKINQYGMKLHSSSKLFSDQLFDGYLAIYMVHCLMVYTTQRVHTNRKFTISIDLLFNP